MSTLCTDQPAGTTPNNHPEEENDREDMLALAHGDGAALNTLMERYSTRLFHYLLRQLNDEHDAQDIAQETFVRIYENASRYDPRKKFTTWMYAIATNLVKDRFRYIARHPALSLDALETTDNESAPRNLRDSKAPNPYEETDCSERSRAVQKAIASLPEELKTPLILFTYQDLSQGEIAQVLSCSTKAVEVRIYRARQQLRTKLESLLQPGSN